MLAEMLKHGLLTERLVVQAHPGTGFPFPAHGRRVETGWSLRSLPTQTFQWFCNTKVIKEPVVSRKYMKVALKCTWTMFWDMCGRTCTSGMFMSEARSWYWSDLVGTLQFLKGSCWVGRWDRQKILLSGPGTEQRDVHNQVWLRPPEDEYFLLFDSTLKRTGCSYLTSLIIGKHL